MQPWCSPDRVGELRPSDLLACVILYENLYLRRPEEE